MQCPCSYSAAPPLSLATLSASLKGYRTKLFDFDIPFYKERNILFNLWNYLAMLYYFFDSKIIYKLTLLVYKKNISLWSSKIFNSDPDIVGLTVSRNNVLFSLCLAKKLKEAKKDIKIIVGGIPCYDTFLKRYKSILNSPYIDTIISGEGHIELRKFLDNIETEKNHIIKINLENLNDLPMPDYSKMNLNEYPPQMFIRGSRGCVNSCYFCIENTLSKGYQEKSLKKLLREIVFLKNKYQISSFSFADSLINVSEHRLRQFCDYLIKNEINIKWRGGAIIKKEMTSELLKKMKKAGCYGLVYGVESGCDTELKKMNKNYDSKLAKKVIKNTKKAKLVVTANWIVNFPNSNWLEFIKTLRFIWQNRNFIDYHSVANYGITPGSYVYKNYKKFGLSSNNKTFFWRSKESNYMGRIIRYVIFKTTITFIGKKYKRVLI